MDEVFTRDLVRLLNTNDPFMTEAREMCDLVGMPLDPLVDFTNDPNDSNPVLGHAQGVKRLVLRQFIMLRSFWNVEESDFLHCYDLVEDCSGWNTNANDTATTSAKAAKMYQLVVQSPTR